MANDEVHPIVAMMTQLREAMGVYNDAIFNFTADTSLEFAAEAIDFLENYQIPASPYAAEIDNRLVYLIIAIGGKLHRRKLIEETEEVLEDIRNDPQLEEFILMDAARYMSAKIGHGFRARGRILSWPVVSECLYLDMERVLRRWINRLAALPSCEPNAIVRFIMRRKARWMPPATVTRVLEEMQQSDTCNICYGEFIGWHKWDQLATRCGHRFCTECWIEVFEATARDPDIGNAGPGRTGQIIPRCPTCRADVLAEHMISGAIFRSVHQPGYAQDECERVNCTHDPYDEDCAIR